MSEVIETTRSLSSKKQTDFPEEKPTGSYLFCTQIPRFLHSNLYLYIHCMPGKPLITRKWPPRLPHKGCTPKPTEEANSRRRKLQVIPLQPTTWYGEMVEVNLKDIFSLICGQKDHSSSCSLYIIVVTPHNRQVSLTDSTQNKAVLPTA